jgi:hypothetical protein
MELRVEGDLARGERGSVDRAVVLVDRIDCRGRRAARGPRDTRANSPRNRRESSPSVREHRRGERAPEAGSRRQSREIGGGRSLRMWAPHMSISKALRAGEAVFVDARAAEAVLAPRELSARPGGSGARQGASEALIISVDRG